MTQPAASPWANEQVCARLKELWLDHSATQICAKLFYEFKICVTRNAVIGFLHRQNLTVNDKKQTRHPKTPEGRRPRSSGRIRSNPFRRPAVTSNDPPLLSCVEIISRNLNVLELKHGDCRYPYGDSPFTFCGHPKASHPSYCPSHAALCGHTPLRLSEADHQRRKMHFMTLTKQSVGGYGMTYLEWQPSAHETINGMLNLMVEQSGYTLAQLRAHNRSVSLVRARRIIAKKMFAERFTKAQIGRFLQRDATVIGDYLGGRRVAVVNEGVGA